MLREKVAGTHLENNTAHLKYRTTPLNILNLISTYKAV